MNNVVMYSGGIDSFLTHQWLKHNAIDHELIYFNLGTKYANDEINMFQSDGFISYVKEKVNISDCLHMGSLEHEDAHVPNRNILTAIMANSVTGYDNIWIGGTLSDRTNDNTSKCFKTLSSLLSYVNDRKITISSPFWMNHKPDLVKSYVETNGWSLLPDRNEARKSLVLSTFSCYYPNESKVVEVMFEDPEDSIYQERKPIYIETTECLECKACFRKCMSLYAGGIRIPMLKTDKSMTIVNEYECEAIESLNRIRETHSADLMKSRYEWTIRYCDYVRKAWK